MTAPLLVAPTTPGGAAFAPAFADDATLVEPDLGPAFDAEVRTGADGTVHILTVHNTTGEQQEFAPEELLPQADGPLLFLGGSSTTAERDGRLLARLQPHGFVQLGRLLDRPESPHTPDHRTREHA